MAFIKKSVAIFIAIMAAHCAISMAAEFNVGDAAGWTSRGGVHYQDWAAANSFHAGDTLVFNYNNQFHNVKQVTVKDFESCNPTSPIATYNDGSDTVTLDRPGHYYFICGFPGHCLAGQKVHVSVVVPSPNPSPAPTHAAISSPSSSGSPATHKLSWVLAILSAAASCLSIVVF